MANVCGVPYYLKLTEWGGAEVRGLQDHASKFTTNAQASQIMKTIRSKAPLSVVPYPYNTKNAV